MKVNVRWKAPVWEMKGRHFQRSEEHIKMFRMIGEYMALNMLVDYRESGKFPNTIGRVRITSGTKTRQHETGIASAREDAHVDDPVGTKRVRKDYVRLNRTGKKVVVNVGRQRKRKPSTS